MGRLDDNVMVKAEVGDDGWRWWAVYGCVLEDEDECSKVLIMVIGHRGV